MGLNGVMASTQNFGTTKTNQTKSKSAESTDSKDIKENKESRETAIKEDAAAVYEKSSDTDNEKKVYKQDTATIAQMKADAEKRTDQLRDLVEKLLLKQGQTFDQSKMYELLREGKVPVDEETAKQAQEDLSEDGYWGVEQTSDRMVSFAMALTGGDPSKVDLMINAVKKGYEQAEAIWGGELPKPCKDTLDATIKKLEKWKNPESTEDTTSGDSQQTEV
jgi:hypothetical protein